MKVIKLFIVYILFINNILAQQVKYEHFISNYKVLSIAKHENYLWLGTEGGIIKYDISLDDFIQYTKVNNLNIQGYLGSIIKSITINETGEVYASGDGLIYYDGYNWHRYTTENSNLPNNEVHYVIIDKNYNVWLGSGEYVCCIINNKWNVYQLLDATLLAYFSINEIAFDSKNVAWIGTSKGLFKIENSIVSKVDTPVLNVEINSIKVDNNDRIMIATKNEGLIVYSSKDNSYIQYNTENSNIPSNYIQYISQASDTSFWIASNQLVNFNNSKFLFFIDKDSLLYKCVINRILADGNTLWIGTADTGLLKYDLTTNICEKKNISNSPLKSNSLSCVVDTNGSMYFIDSGENLKLKIYSNKKWIEKTIDSIEYYNANYNRLYNSDTIKIYEKEDVIIYIYKKEFLGIYSNAPDNGGIIKISHDNKIFVVSSKGELWEYNGINWIKHTKENSNIPTKYIKNICFDKNSNLWFSTLPDYDTIENKLTAGSLVKYNGVDFEVFTISTIPFLSKPEESYISSIYIDPQNELWLSINDLFYNGIEFGNGLFKFDGSNWLNYNINNSNLSSNTINCLNFKDKVLYIGTLDGGLSLYNTKDNSWSNYNSQNSVLPWNVITGIQFDKDNNLYLSIEFNGIIKVNGDMELITNLNTPIEYKNRIIAYPNPFSTKTGWQYTLNKSSVIRVDIYDSFGRLIKTIVNRHYSPGTYYLSWDGTNNNGTLVSEGLYIVILKSNEECYSNKILLIR
jgi:ligand-binding sensor domain-containing protein